VNVLSLFDGIACGMVALQEAGFDVDGYYASEVDESAMSVTERNYPSVKHIGDVKNVNGKMYTNIDLLMGGSPCQGFSANGKGRSFRDPRSILFYEFVRILNESRPRFFLLENVVMRKTDRDTVTSELGVEPILINSSLFGAQHRKRLYWTNIPIGAIIDAEQFFRDILLTPCDSLFLRKEVADRYVPVDNYVFDKNKSCVLGRLSVHQGDRVFDVNGKSSCLLADGGNNGLGGCNIIFDPKNGRLRRISPEECELLQGLPNGYTNVLPKTKRYKAIGNGWTVGVIAHILTGMSGLHG